MTLTLSLLLCLILALLETPLFMVLLALSVACYFHIDFDWAATSSIYVEMNRLASMPILVALPIFTLAGCLLTVTKAPIRIMNFVKALLGHLPGGVSLATIVACALFTALTGASGVTIVALGGLLYPMLTQYGHSEKFSLGLLTVGGSLGLLFPPSLPIILYGVVAQINISDIYKASLIPGIVLVLGLFIYALLTEGLKKAEKTTFSWPALKEHTAAALLELPIPAIILVGIYGGFITLAEVATIVLLYILITQGFIRRELSLASIYHTTINAAVLSGAIIMILGCAMAFTGYLIEEQIPQHLLNSILAITDSRMLFLLGLNIFLLIVGCLMDIFSAIVIVVPIIAPVALKFGIDPFHLAIIFLVNLEIGYATPPVGINLFIAAMQFKKPITSLYRAAVPFLLVLIGLLLIITYVPYLSTFLLTK